MRNACKITDKIFQECINNFKLFKTEKEVYNFLLKKIRENNCKPAFKPIVANNHWEIHPKPRKNKLKKGFLIIDLGVKKDNYCSDMTRTIYLGKPSKKEIELYNLVLKVQETAIKNLRMGDSCSDFHKKHANLFGKNKKYFIHAIGHGVGKNIHQKPIISPKSKDIFEKNHIVTIEPGLYIKNKYGIRIEDTIILKDKPKILTKTTKELIII